MRSSRHTPSRRISVTNADFSSDLDAVFRLLLASGSQYTVAGSASLTQPISATSTQPSCGTSSTCRITSLPSTATLEWFVPAATRKFNPVVVRTRLAYGASAGSPDGTVPFGEVEDDTCRGRCRWRRGRGRSPW